MPAQEPRIVEGHYERDLLAQPGKRSQVEVFAMKVVTMDNVRWFWG
jgi:hypothetical protein